MRLLLDTHAVIWSLYEPAKLPKEVTEALESPDHTVWLSAASTWEIAIKQAVGKLRVDLDDVVGACRRSGFEQLPVTVGHTQATRQLEMHHRDPFDRMLIAQSIIEGCTIVSRDRTFGLYGVPRMWGA